MRKIPTHTYSLLRKIPLFGTIWFFPALVTIVLLLLTAFRIHGSSVGVYDTILKSDSSNSTLVGSSRTIRSDEWFVNTPFILSQKENGFPVVNKDVGSGQDMSVVIDVPYGEWSALFKPQNLIFFVLPLEFAFAFKWWSLIWVLLIATYFLVLTISPRKYCKAALLAVFLGFSPFIQWWYQSITILPIAYIFLLVSLAIYAVRATSTSRKIGLGLAIAYTLTCFTLIMYPAFQIVCALVGIGVFIGIVIDQKLFATILKHKTWIIYLLAVGLSLVLTGLFLYAHRGSIQTITQTTYPGARNIAAGGQSIASMTSWPLGYVPLDGLYADALGGNQSETSRFLLFGILMLPFATWVTFVRKIKAKSKDNLKQRALLLITLLLLMLFAARMFVPLGSGAYKLLGLHLVPHVRLVIGLGLLNVILLTIAMSLPSKPWKSIKSSVDAWAFANFAFGSTVIFALAYYTDRTYAIQSIGVKEIACISLLGGFVVGLISHSALRIRYAGLALATALSIVISLPVNPLSRGIGALRNSEISTYVQQTEKLDSKYWISSENSLFSAIPLAAGAEVFSGVQTYPQLKIWEKYFPNEAATFNRYAHVNFVINDQLSTRSIRLVQADLFEISTPSCDSILNELSIDYIIASNSQPDKYMCFELQKTFVYNGTPLSVYKRIPG